MNTRFPGKKRQISRLSFSSLLETYGWLFDFWQKLCRWRVHFSALKAPQQNERVPMVDVETVTAEKQRNLAFGKDGGRGWSEKNDMKELCFTPNKVQLLLEGGGLLVMCTPWSHGIGHFFCQDQGMQCGMAVRWWEAVFAAGEQDFFTLFHLEQGLCPIYYIAERNGKMARALEGCCETHLGIKILLQLFTVSGHCKLLKVLWFLCSSLFF